MTNELGQDKPLERNIEVKYRGGSSDAVYAIGIFGAWVYYIGRAGTFQEGVLGFLKGLVWPAFLVYDVLVFLHKE
jgi:hypothetical protein